MIIICEPIDNFVTEIQDLDYSSPVRGPTQQLTAINALFRQRVMAAKKMMRYVKAKNKKNKKIN